MRGKIEMKSFANSSIVLKQRTIMQEKIEKNIYNGSIMQNKRNFNQNIYTEIC